MGKHVVYAKILQNGVVGCTNPLVRGTDHINVRHDYNYWRQSGLDQTHGWYILPGDMRLNLDWE